MCTKTYTNMESPVRFLKGAVSYAASATELDLHGPTSVLSACCFKVLMGLPHTTTLFSFSKDRLLDQHQPCFEKVFEWN